MTEKPIVRLCNLPASVRGFCYHDDDGAPLIVLNARLTREQNRRTYDHELKHIENDELDDKTYREYN